MTYQTLVLIMVLPIVAMAWYANASKRNKIYCRIRMPDNTLMSRFVKMTSRYVVFGGRTFDVIKSCITYEWWDKGLVHMLFPQRVATMDYTYESRWPLDPKTLRPVVITPEVRNAFNKEEWARAYHKSYSPPGTKKAGFFQQWLPLITIGLVLLVVVYVVMNFQAIRGDLTILSNQLKAIAQ